MTTKKDKTIRALISLVLIAVIGFSAYKFTSTFTDYKKGDDYYSAMRLEPAVAEDGETAMQAKVTKLKKENSDVVGWLKIDATRIDYPIVKSKDNKDYLRTGLNGKYLYNGTPFIDYRCKGDFSDFVTVIYGHNMKNGAMFSQLEKLGNDSFLSTADGTVITESGEYKLEFFAFIETKDNDSNVYIFGEKTEDERQRFIDYLKEHSNVYIDKGQTVNDNIVVLSTCSYDFNSARMIAAARLIKK